MKSSLHETAREMQPTTLPAPKTAKRQPKDRVVRLFRKEFSAGNEDARSSVLEAVRGGGAQSDGLELLGSSASEAPRLEALSGVIQAVGVEDTLLAWRSCMAAWSPASGIQRP